MADVRRTDPTTQEWAMAMEASGGDGGCMADTISRRNDDPPFSKMQGIAKVDDPRNNNGAPATVYEHKRDSTDILSSTVDVLLRTGPERRHGKRRVRNHHLARQLLASS